MNPYDFVRIDWDAGIDRRRPNLHDRFSGLSGRIEGTITTLTPLFIPEPGVHSPKSSLTNGHHHPIIPGSSLKGLFRSLAETIGPGCWWLFKGEHEHKLPHVFRQCPKGGNLCIACRMFGLIEGRKNGMLLLGHVGFDDAVCQEPQDHPAVYTIILSSPKPRHRAFYLYKNGKLAGRKYYFHHSTPPYDPGCWLPKGKASSQRDAQNQYIKPLGADSVFTFSAHFDNLAQDELCLLLYTLVLEPGVHHKIGYAKPAGLGSVKIALTRLELVDYNQRYTSPSGGKTVYQGDELDQFVGGKIGRYTGDEASITLQDLRRIWAWPGRSDIQYPSWSWFQHNSERRLHETP
jgi:CRISPR/Cas system CSM-associated protein Csm3 (group 7 of RAMP superfamily)